MFKEEEAIVWLDDPAKYPYLREVRTHAFFRKRRINAPNLGHLIGYSTVKKAVPSNCGMFDRRAWFFRDTDPYPIGRGYPCEAVKPSSVQLGQASESGRADEI
jgi:Family of unknown function (DUF6009)